MVDKCAKAIQQKKAQCFQQMVPEEFDTHMKKKNKPLDTESIAFTKINSKWIADFIVKHKIRKFLKI